MEETLITTPAQLHELVNHVRAVERFAFDTEFVSEETFEPVLCLIQVATAERLAVIDPLQVGDLSPFWSLVHDPALEVVMHAAGEDMRICLLRTGKIPRRVFDVQIAAGLVGYSYPLSLVNLVAQVLKVPLAGSETRTDWRRRPLTRAQLHYALDDVRYLLAVADHLSAELARMGRTDWAEAEFADSLQAIANRADEDRWRRLPGLHQLSRRGLEMARRLAEWREDEARRQNRPLRQMLRDDLLVAIAKRQPSSRRDLEALRDFNRPSLVSRSSVDPGRARSGPRRARGASTRTPPAARRQPGRVDRRQSALGRARAVVRSEQSRRLARGQCLRPQAPDPLVPRRPARARSARLARRLAWRALRPSAAGSARRPENLSRRRPRQ